MGGGRGGAGAKTEGGVVLGEGISQSQPCHGVRRGRSQTSYPPEMVDEITDFGQGIGRVDGCHRDVDMSYKRIYDLRTHLAAARCKPVEVKPVIAVDPPDKGQGLTLDLQWPLRCPEGPPTLPTGGACVSKGGGGMPFQGG